MPNRACARAAPGASRVIPELAGLPASTLAFIAGVHSPVRASALPR